jgi:hypothetical protein
VQQVFMEAFNWGSSLKETAAGIGITTQELQQLSYAASQTGVDSGKLQKAFVDLRKVVRGATEGNAEQIAVLKALGFTQDQIATGNIDIMDAFMKVGQAMAAATTEQEKFNIATAVFGDKIALDMIRLMSNFGEMKKIISETPLISEADADRLDKMADRADRIHRTIRALAAISISRSGDFLGPILGAISPGAPGMIRGLLGGLEGPASTYTPTPGDKAAADALAKAGRKSAIAAATTSPEVSQLATIGGAAGFNGQRMRSPELDALEKIEANTRPAGPTAPANGSTDFSKFHSQTVTTTPNAPAAPASTGLSGRIGKTLGRIFS